MRIVTLVVAGVLALITPNAWSAAYPTPRESDWVVHDFRFHTGEVLPDLRLHYATVGEPTGEPVLILHGTTGNGKVFLADTFAGELFGPGQPLDARRYYIILPDDIGAGASSKPSDGLRGKFPAFDYDDMVRAQYRLVAEHLGVRHLRLIIGGSQGGMHAWMWSEMYPTFMDAIMPLQCLPVEIAGVNRMLRRVIIDGIKNDPEWMNGNYEKQPVRGLTLAAYGNLALFGNPYDLYKASPTREQADAAFDQRIADFIASNDANDVLYQYSSSRDYNPVKDLPNIKARVLAINTADDNVNPFGLGVMKREIKQVPNGRYALIPKSDDTIGHGSYRIGQLYKQYIQELLAGR